MLLLHISLFGQAGEMGDVNENGIVDIIDALLISQYYVGLPVPHFNSYYADVNCSGNIDIVDALLTAQYYVELIFEFSCILNPTPEPTINPDLGRVFIYPETKSIYSGEHFTTNIHVYTDLFLYAYIEFLIRYDDRILRANDRIGFRGIEEGFIALPAKEVYNNDGLLRVRGENPPNTVFGLPDYETYIIHRVSAYSEQTTTPLEFVISFYYK